MAVWVDRGNVIPNLLAYACHPKSGEYRSGEDWEGDEWNSLLGPLKMRACDHQAIMDMYASEFVHPNKWFEGFAFYGKIIRIPAKYVTPALPEDLERCKK